MIGEKMKANWGIEGTNLVAENPCIEIAKGKEAVSPWVLAAALPNPEVPDKASRRRFTAEYKLRILNQAVILLLQRMKSSAKKTSGLLTASGRRRSLLMSKKKYHRYWGSRLRSPRKEGPTDGSCTDSFL